MTPPELCAEVRAALEEFIEATDPRHRDKRWLRDRLTWLAAAMTAYELRAVVKFAERLAPSAAGPETTKAPR